jgi:hypothetical protein
MAKKKVTTTTVVEEIIDDNKPKASRILVVLDRSGSMNDCRDEAINGFNKFLSDQKALPGECSFSLMLFDNVIEDPVVDQPIALVSPLNYDTFVPRGMTALYDAVGTMVNRHNSKHNPNVKTILVILTDGEENSSHKYNKASVGKLIKDVENEYGWETLFLGSGFNVDAVANDIGVKSMNRMKFDTSKLGQTMGSYTVASASASAYRMGNAAVNMSTVVLDDEETLKTVLDTGTTPK